VYGAVGGTFIMDGGNIMKNTASTNGGGVYMTGDPTKFTMNGGNINGNEAVSTEGNGGNGGGVYVDTGVIFIIEPTTSVISNNKAVNGNGGGVYVKGEFKTESVRIENNTATKKGGGVYVGSDESNAGIFLMNTGTHITENKVQDKNGQGGGVYVQQKGTFTMTIGNISGNGINPGKAGEGNWESGDDGKGCGVYVEDGGTFSKIGGVIHGALVPGDEGNAVGEVENLQNYYGTKIPTKGNPYSAGFTIEKGYAVYYAKNGEPKFRDYTVYDGMSTENWGTDPNP
jgi:predicted outer membrane repeat protein